MMKKLLRMVAHQPNLYRFLLVMSVLLATQIGCSTKTTVVLVPDPDGKLGSAVVATSAGEVELTQTNEAVAVSDPNNKPAAPHILDQQEIDRRFGAALAIQPSPPDHFLLYFQHQSSILVQESKQQLAAAVEAITERQSQHISVIGHADTSGNRDYNLQLSRERAQQVQQLLIDSGIEPQFIQTTSHGEENPLIKTGDNTAEPRNRRVEIVVR